MELYRSAFTLVFIFARISETQVTGQKAKFIGIPSIRVGAQLEKNTK